MMVSTISQTNARMFRALLLIKVAPSLIQMQMASMMNKINAPTRPVLSSMPAARFPTPMVMVSMTIMTNALM